MIIDFHTHVYPPKQQAAPAWQGKCPMTIENVLAAQDRHGVDATVISNHTPYLRHADLDKILADHREINKFLAEQQQSMPARSMRSPARSRTGATTTSRSSSARSRSTA